MLFLVPLLATFPARAAAPALKQESASGITHSFLALGAETYIADGAGKVVWTYPLGTRDGFVLPNGNVVLAVSKGGEFPGGGAVEVTRDGKELFRYKGTQSEVNTVQASGDGRYLLTEAGPKPRLLEVDRSGKVLAEVPIRAQVKDTHLQTRMSRKLRNGNYLVPQLLDKVVREYTPAGEVAWEAKTPDEPPECWPFTAIRLPDGNTLSTCTHGNTVVEFDAGGRVVWQLSNADLPHSLLKDPCGGQRLPNGNTVICSYGQNKPGEVKLLEVTPQKQVVWTLRDDRPHGIHEVQILDTNGKPLDGRPMK
jgi:Mal s 1 allergenic protein-like